MPEVIIQHPTKDMWTKSLKQLLGEQPGPHMGYTPVTLMNKFFFDYVDENGYEAVADTPLSEEEKADLSLVAKRICPENTVEHHWSSISYKKLEARVTKVMGKRYVPLIENKLVLICTVDK